MLCRSFLTSVLAVIAVAFNAVLVSVSAPLAQFADEIGPDKNKTLSITIRGTLRPVIQGTDPADLDGTSVIITAMASESLKPISHTTDSATYSLSAGAITMEGLLGKLTTTSSSKMTVKLTSTADILTLIFAVKVTGITVTFTDTTSLPPNCWMTSVLKHPAAFSPAKLTLTEPSSKLKYSAGGYTTTVLGLSGTASDSETADPILPDAE